MQRFNSPLTPEDRYLIRRIGRIVLIVYSSTALVLTAGVVARVALKNKTNPKAAIEASTMPDVPPGAVSLR
jgi:multisubunit Na+/H+ antiporter MnhE subunit